tara:strand:- start:163 stop:327 length:165 start_codon:yes stop_codon:yes gene_type:complete
MKWFIDMLELDNLLKDQDEWEPIPLSIEPHCPELENERDDQEEPESIKIIIIDM